MIFPTYGTKLIGVGRSRRLQRLKPYNLSEGCSNLAAEFLKKVDVPLKRYVVCQYQFTSSKRISPPLPIIKINHQPSRLLNGPYLTGDGNKRRRTAEDGTASNTAGASLEMKPISSVLPSQRRPFRVGHLSISKMGPLRSQRPVTFQCRLQPPKVVPVRRTSPNSQKMFTPRPTMSMKQNSTGCLNTALLREEMQTACQKKSPAFRMASYGG